MTGDITPGMTPGITDHGIGPIILIGIFPVGTGALVGEVSTPGIILPGIMPGMILGITVLVITTGVDIMEDTMVVTMDGTLQVTLA